LSAHRDETAEAILEGLVHAGSDFAASHVQLDDVTAVLIKVEEGAWPAHLTPTDHRGSSKQRSVQTEEDRHGSHLLLA
jgi:hypothetical protein